MPQPRLLLADDHPETAELLRGLLQPEFDVVAHVQDGLALVGAADRLSPDVIVSDISMPGLDGISAAAAILRRNPAARIVLVTVHGDPTLVERGLATGALGYVLKVAAGEELIPAVHAALRGERHVSQVLRTTRKQYDPNQLERLYVCPQHFVRHVRCHETDLEHIAQLAVTLSGRLTRVHCDDIAPAIGDVLSARSPRPLASTSASCSSSPSRALSRERTSRRGPRAR